MHSLAQARRSSVEICDNIRKKMSDTVRVVSIMLHNQNGQQDFDLNWKKEVVGTVDANQKFEDCVFKCRFEKNKYYITFKKYIYYYT